MTQFGSVTTDAGTRGSIPRMPAFFGRQGGPRQRVDRPERHPQNVGACVATWVATQADPDTLAALLPAGFELAEPLLIVEAASLSGLPWLAGRGYEMVMVSVPVIFTQQGVPIVGRLELVTWENCADAIVSGRDELGFNKVYADGIILTEAEDHISWSVSWGGTQFLSIEVALDDEDRGAPTWNSGPVFHYRVLPRTGQWGETELEQVTAPTASPTSMTVVSTKTGQGKIRFESATFDELPTLVHIVNSLASLALGGVVSSGHSRMTGWSDIESMRIVAAWAAAPPRIHSLRGESGNSNV